MTALVTTYPLGGIAKPEGRGLFSRPDDDGDGEGLRVWVDAALRGRTALIGALQDEGATISARHEDAQTQLLILAPGSLPVFDLYCHPEWLGTRLRRWYYSMKAKGKLSGEESWRSKLILREEWVAKCIAAGKFLGAADDWGACRVGGPPRNLAENVITASVPLSTSLPPPRSAPFQRDSAVTSPAAPSLGEPFPPKMAAEQPIKAPAEAAEETSAAEPSGDPESSTASAAPERSEQQSPARTPDFEDVLMEALATSPVESPGSKVSEPLHELGQEETADEGGPSPDLEAKVGPREQSPTSIAVPPHHQPSPDSSSSEIVEPLEELPPLPLRMSPEARIYADAAEEARPLSKSTTDPSAIFAGLRFWVDLKRPNRKDLITRIKQAGGGIAAVYTDATHVLIHQYKAADWASLVRLYVQEGIWFMHIAWAVKCLEQGVRLPELGEHVPGGAPVLLDTEKPDISAENRESRFRGESYMPTETIAELLTEAATGIAAGQTRTDAMYALERKNGTYTVSSWRNLFDSWRLGTGRFAKLENNTYASSALGENNVIVPLDEDTSDLKDTKPDNIVSQGRLPHKVLDRIMRSVYRKIVKGKPLIAISERLAQKHGVYTPKEWRKIYHERNSRTGRFKDWPRLSDVANDNETSPNKNVRESISPAKPRVPQVTKPPSASQSKTSVVADNSKPARLSVEEMDQLFRESAHPGSSSRDIAEKLFNERATYTTGTWTNYVNEWRNGEGRFAARPGTKVEAKASATPTPPEKPFSRKRAASTSSSLEIPPSKKRTIYPGAYTEEEERAMAAYIVDRLPDATKVTPRDWVAFQTKHPKRSAAAYCERYRGQRARIEEYARQYADTIGLREQLDGVLDGSARSQSQKSSEVDVMNEVIDIRSDSEDADYVDQVVAED